MMLLSGSINSQLSISNGKHVLEISGMASAFFKYRVMKPGFQFDKKNNLFELRDAQLQLEGRVGNVIEYELQADFADLFSGLNDPENPGLMDAYFMYKIPKAIGITAGFQKTPYGRGNFVPFLFSPFIQRAEIARGQIYSSRDVGVTLSYSCWKQLLNFYAGVYTGQGELILKGSNDVSGKFEYIVRADVAYPVRNRYHDLDENNSPIPSFSVGINGRYSEKSGTVNDEYRLRIINGKKYTYGADLSVKYKGFSLQAELHQLFINPNDPSRLMGYPTNYFRAGGYYVQLSYTNKKLKSAFAARFDELNQNDLVRGYQRRFTASYCFMLKPYTQMLKFNYTRILSEEDALIYEPLKWRDMIRVGWVYAFK